MVGTTPKTLESSCKDIALIDHIYYKPLPVDNNDISSTTSNYEIVYSDNNDLSCKDSASLISSELIQIDISDNLNSSIPVNNTLDIDEFLDNLSCDIDFSSMDTDDYLNTVLDKVQSVINPFSTDKCNTDLCLDNIQGNFSSSDNFYNNKSIDYPEINSQKDIAENLSESGYGSDTGESISSNCHSPVLNIQNDWDWMESYTDLFPTLLGC